MTRALVLAFALCGATALAQNPPSWTAQQQPVPLWGNTYYVGTRGLSAILITSDAGHVLIDGAMEESAGAIASSIRALGFRVEDVRLILNSHAHFDHAGGIAELQRLSGATVAARVPSARVLESGRSGPDDPQFGVLSSMRPVSRVQIVADGETLRVGPLALTAHATAGHTPGGTSWSWRSCQGERCAEIVYADSLTAVSADGFLFTRSKEYPNAVQDFERGFATLSDVPCDILLTPHPDASGLWERLARRDGGARDALLEENACRRYVNTARIRLRARLAMEGGL